MYELSKEEKAELKRVAIQGFEVGFFEARFYEKIGNLFKWEGDIEFPERFEFLLRLYGSIGYSIPDKRWYVGITDGRTDDLGRPIGYNGHKLSTNKEAKKFDIGKDFILLWNNTLHLSDAPIIQWYSDLLKEGDISLKCQLINSRNIPIIAASDDDLKNQIVKALNGVYAGKPFVITTDRMQEANTIDILDPSMVDKLQYLTAFSDEIKKRLYSEFGISINNEDKRAQVSIEELQKEDDLITLNYLSYYESRLKFVEQMKEAGINISVTPSPIFATEPTKEQIDDPEEYKEELKEKEDPQAPAEDESGKEGNDDEKKED